MRHVIASLVISSVALLACDTDTSRTATTTQSTTTAVVVPVASAPLDVCAATTAGADDGIATARMNHADCQVDADCTVTVAVTGCGESQQAVSFVGLLGFGAEVAEVDAQLCADRPASCGSTVTDSLATTAQCVSGTCELMRGDETCMTAPAPEGTVLTVESCLDCGAAAAKAAHAIGAEVAALNACESDAECVIADDTTGCGGTCGRAINTASQGAFAEALSNIDADYCSGDCPVAVPACLAVSARCVAHRCAIVGD